jgi:hypothetical protein
LLLLNLIQKRNNTLNTTKIIETHSEESTKISESDKCFAVELLKINFMKEIYRSAVFKLLDKKTNLEILQQIDLRKITRYFNNKGEEETKEVYQNKSEASNEFLGKKSERNVKSCEKKKANSKRKLI